MLLSKIGIHGIPLDQQIALFSSLTLGEPALLIGRHGTAKTAIIDGIGAALREYDRARHPNDPETWFNYQIYDASKVNFEDLIGIPNPKALREGRMEFINAPSTVWDKGMVCFDEFSRQLPERQNNIFELIRSRRCVGIKVPKLLYILNAMNPMSYKGTEELDEALIDRHLYFIFFKDFNEMAADVKQLIIEAIGRDDAPALKHALGKHGKYDTISTKLNEELARTGKFYKSVLTQSAKNFAKISKEQGQSITKIISAFLNTLKMLETYGDQKLAIEISGRRAGMLRRGVIAYLAVAQTLGIDWPAKELISASIRLSLPIGLLDGTTGASFPAAVNLINTALQSSAQNDSDALWTVYEVLNTNRPVTFLYKLMLAASELDPANLNHLWSTLLANDYSKIKEKLATFKVASSGNVIPNDLLIRALVIAANYFPNTPDNIKTELNAIEITPRAFLEVTTTNAIISKSVLFQNKDNSVVHQLALFEALALVDQTASDYEFQQKFGILNDKLNALTTMMQL